MIDWTAIRQNLLPKRGQSVLPLRIKLPILPITVMRLVRKSEDPDADPHDIARIIETDSSLTCELLRYVNSAAIGLSHQVRCAQQAISILGIQACKMFLLWTAIKRSMKGVESRLLDLEAFWAANMERALFAREVGVLLDADHDLAFAGGMLQDFLLPVITNELYTEYREFLQLQRDEPMNLVDWERRQFGWDHAEAAAHVMDGWEFPDSLICCAFLHHHGLKLLQNPQFQHTAASAVAVSAFLPGPLNQDAAGPASLFRLDDAWPDFDLFAIARRVDQRMEEISIVSRTRQKLLSKLEQFSVTAR